MLMIDGSTPVRRRDLEGTSGVSPGNASAPNSVASTQDIFDPPPSAPSSQPAEVPTGTVDYYRQRYADFVRRNPGVPPPDYYLAYGDKYCRKFESLGPNDLSPAGLAWRDRCLKNLQEAIEQKRRDDPEGFAKLERDPQAFKAFAYGTHPDAYIKAGLFQLPAEDLIKIATTPELKDLLGPEGIKQVLAVAAQTRPNDVAAIVGATAMDELRRHPLPQLPTIALPIPHLPELPGDFGKTIIRSIVG